ncbi:DUF2339 domain-containing protein [Algibacter sp. L4_22]|uniref:DUF2339 domain-containing protein n=1 Tax=Algibacter sp. L4_22 TaxID=2942477 RepID=UPI00201B96EB|nr:DUF2339 domain-containing protein [Algibacter sp. L4_22]MCL5127744.1 DUF2339 domain-containing protein [Algibacter sp. L4_22]
MEYILSVLIIILLIFQNSKYSRESSGLKKEIESLNEKLNSLHYLLKTELVSRTDKKVTPDKESVQKESVKEEIIPEVIKEDVLPPIEVPLTEQYTNEESVEEIYKPTYPSVVKLNDKDVGIIKNILVTAETSEDYKTLIKLRDKMVEVLGINNVKEETDIEFIRTLLEDYKYYTDTKNIEGVEAEMLLKTVDSAKTMAAAREKEVPQEPTVPLWERFKQKNPDLEKFIGENLINKIGILILVLGISYFVKYAIDKDWINEPARVGIGILAGSLVLFIAHKLREKYAPFSSVLVAGAIAIFYFTIAIAFHEYKLFSQEVAFGIMVVITAFSCLISLSYNRMELAILSLIGGFAVPFMVSTGSGNYLVLFTYIAILDIGILALAYFKKWQLLHILAFVFTILLFGGWVSKDVFSAEPHYLGALIFGFVFYLIFMVMTTISNLRSKGTFTGIQLTMLTTNNFVFYSIGMLVLTEYKPELRGLFTAFLALLNMGYSLLLFKKFGLDKKGIYLLIGLSLTFITLAIPIQFSGNNITIFWAIEAVMLMWLAQKSQIKSYRFAAVAVQILMLGSLLMDWLVYTEDSELTIILNPIFIAGILVVASLVAVHFLLRKDTEKLLKFGLQFNPVFYKKIAGIAAVIVGYFVGLVEVIYQSDQYFEFLGMLSVSLQYHLLFSAVFCFILYRNRTVVKDKIINVLAVFNIVTFAVGFYRIAMMEFEDNILYGNNSSIAYYLHILAIAFVIYFWYLIYNSNKTRKVFSIFNHKLAIWIAVFLLVLLASTEVILQGIYLMDFSSTEETFAANYRLISTGQYKIIKTGLPVLWGILSFVLLLWGIKKQLKSLRIIALTLLGITIVKLFAYDISNVSETGKIIAFILLGILILIISFIYQKIKVLVIDEEKTTENEDID